MKKKLERHFQLPWRIRLASSQDNESEVHSSIMITCVSLVIFAAEKRPSGTIFVINLEGMIPLKKNFVL